MKWIKAITGNLSTFNNENNRYRMKKFENTLHSEDIICRQQNQSALMEVSS